MTAIIWLDLVIVKNVVDPLRDDEKKVEVEIPEGYHRVFSGRVREGDLFLDRRLMASGQVSWLEVVVGEDRPDDDRVIRRARRDAGSFVCVIRPGPAPANQVGCERCKAYGRGKGKRFCTWCEAFLISANKS